jgi:hypothetical protein
MLIGFTFRTLQMTFKKKLKKGHSKDFWLKVVSDDKLACSPVCAVTSSLASLKTLTFIILATMHGLLSVHRF